MAAFFEIQNRNCRLRIKAAARRLVPEVQAQSLQRFARTGKEPQFFELGHGTLRNPFHAGEETVVSPIQQYLLLVCELPVQ